MKNQVKKYDHIQIDIFNDIRKKLGENVSLVEYVADLLNVSSDAAYRRIRGAKELGINEFLTLCVHFNISLDNLMGLSNDHVMFRYKTLNSTQIEHYCSYMNSLGKTLEDLKRVKNKQIVLVANDIPIFHLLHFKELALFKIFVWFNSMANKESAVKFGDFINEFESEELLSCYSRMANDYLLIPSIEIWTHETIDSILSLIRFYTEAGYFASLEMPLKLCKQLISLIEMLQKWCMSQSKNKQNVEGEELKLYLSDVALENSFVVFTEEEQKLCLLKLYTINSLQTRHDEFIKESEEWIKSTINKSLLISGASQKERNRFFSRQKQKIAQLENEIREVRVESAM